MKLLYLSALAIMLASCGSDDSPTPNNSIEHPISLASVSLGSVTDFTRAGESDNVSSSTRITSGSLGLFITKNGDKTESKYICDNAKFTYNEDHKTWSCDNTYYWASDDATIEYIAYYPYKEISDDKITWDVSDQTTSKDLCYTKATATNSADNHSIAINLEHLCSKLVVNITKFGDEFGENKNVQGIKLGGLACQDQITISDGKWVGMMESGDITMKSVTTTEGSLYTYEAILIPQMAAVTLTVTVNGEEYIMKLSSQTFKKGTQYTLNIQVGQDITKAGAITRTPWIETVGGTITVE